MSKSINKLIHLSKKFQIKLAQENNNPKAPWGNVPVSNKKEQVRDLGEIDNPINKAVNKPSLQQIPKDTQQALNTLGFKGKDGRALDLDGKLGQNTQFALDAYRAKNKSRIPQRFEQNGSGLYMMIQRDAGGENKTTTFDYTKNSNSLNAISASLAQLQDWSREGKFNAQNANSYYTVLLNYTRLLFDVDKELELIISNDKSTAQEKQQANSLMAQSSKLYKDVLKWNEYFKSLISSPSKMQLK